MKGLTKVDGIGTEDIVQFLTQNHLSYKIKPHFVLVNPQTGYSSSMVVSAFKSRILISPQNKERIFGQFPIKVYNNNYDYRAHYRIDSLDFLEGISGLVEIANGLVVVDTSLEGICPLIR